MAPRVVLVESDEQMPALFPIHAAEALRAAGRVLVRSLDHPSVVYLQITGIEVELLEPAPLELAGMNLSEPGDPAERRYARALVSRAQRDGSATYLMGPGDGDGFTRAVGMATTKATAELEFVFHGEPPTGTQVLRLAAIEQRLRGPEGGCPWDLEQDHRTLAHFLVEETYELLDAIESGDDSAIVEELGDVLLQVVFHAQIAADRDAFDLDDVARGIADKLVHRHPHVFGDVEVSGAAEVVANWEVLKQEEKGRQGPFDGIPTALPALQLATKVQKRASKHGVEPATADDPAELRARLADSVATDASERERAVGDLLSAAVALARELDVDPEQALRAAVARLRDLVERDLADPSAPTAAQ